MKHFNALPGEDIKDTCHKLYHLAIELNEPILSHFNGITIMMTPDDDGIEHARNNIDLITNHWLKHDFKKYVSDETLEFLEVIQSSEKTAEAET